MKKGMGLLVFATILGTAVSLPAQEPSLHGYLRHQLGTLFDGADIIRNDITAELELGYQGSDVDLFLNPYFEANASNEIEFGLREGYIDYFSEHLDLRIGKQIIIWGKADGLAITDIVSPKDLDNFLIPDFRELRLGVIAAKANTYIGPTVLELIYIPVFTPSELPAPGTIWATTLETPIMPTILPAPEIGLNLADGEFYGRLRIQSSLIDLDLAGAYYLTNEPSLSITKEFESPGVLSSLTIQPEYYRQWLAGAAMSSSVGPFILRAESGWFTPKRFLVNDMSDTDGFVEKNYLQSLIGADTVLAGVDLSVQVMHQYVIEHQESMQQDEHSWTATVRLRRSFFREQLIVDAFSYIGFNAPDALLKVGLSWAPVDALLFRAEGNIFFGDSGQFGAYDGNDLLVISTRYSF